MSPTSGRNTRSLPPQRSDGPPPPSVVSWKDQNCVFRTDERTRLKSVPTLLKLGSAQRLQEEQLTDAGLVEMLFSE